MTRIIDNSTIGQRATIKACIARWNLETWGFVALLHELRNYARQVMRFPPTREPKQTKQA